MPSFLGSRTAGDGLTWISGSRIDGNDVGPVAGFQRFSLFSSKESRESAYIVGGISAGVALGFLLSSYGMDNSPFWAKLAVTLVCTAAGFKKVHDDVIGPIKEHRKKILSDIDTLKKDISTGLMNAGQGKSIKFDPGSIAYVGKHRLVRLFCVF